MLNQTTNGVVVERKDDDGLGRWSVVDVGDDEFVESAIRDAKGDDTTSRMCGAGQGQKGARTVQRSRKVRSTKVNNDSSNNNGNRNTDYSTQLKLARTKSKKVEPTKQQRSRSQRRERE